MAYYTRGEFAEKCGLKKETARAYIAQNIKRGKVIQSGKFIDDTIQQNKEFLEKEIEKNAGKFAKEKPEKKLRLERPDFSNIKEPEIEDFQDEEGEMSGNTLSGLDKKYKLALLKKLGVDTRINEHKEARLKAEVIHIDLAKVIISQLAQSFITEFKNTAEDILTLFAKKKQMNSNEIAEMRGSLISCINSASDNSVQLSIKNISSIVGEFAEKREPGERK